MFIPLLAAPVLLCVLPKERPFLQLRLKTHYTQITRAHTHTWFPTFPSTWTSISSKYPQIMLIRRLKSTGNFPGYRGKKTQPWKEGNAAGIHLPSPLSSPRTQPTPCCCTEPKLQSDSKVPFNGKCSFIWMACFVVFALFLLLCHLRSRVPSFLGVKALLPLFLSCPSVEELRILQCAFIGY